MSFKDIKGQDRAVSFLSGIASTGRVGHAYIFYGPNGVGKSLAAMNFAKAVNCSARTPSGSCDTSVSPGSHPELTEGCDSCPSCRKIDSGNHPDLLLLRPDKELSPVGIDDVRALIKDIGLKPYEGRKKFYIIDGASAMKEEASNALLKTLEEPPSDSVIILIADSLAPVLSTIVSRAQVVKFFPLGIGEVKEILVKNYGVDGTKAHIASHLSSGRLGEALRYKDEDFLARRQKAVTALAAGTFFDSDFDKLAKPELRTYLGIMLTWYRDMLVAKAAPERGPELINIDRARDVLDAAAGCDIGRIEDAIARVLGAFSHIEQNANPKLVMAALGVSI